MIRPVLRTSPRTFAVFASLGVLAAANAHCSLGLDPALMKSGPTPSDAAAATAASLDADRASAPSPEDSAAPDGASTPAATSASPGTTCNTDADCASTLFPGACVTSATCDPTYHVCMFDVCNVGSCAVASCDLLAKTCSQPVDTDFTISVFSIVSGGVGGTSPAVAIAAAYPFLFVLTTNGVVAYDVANPTGNVPSMVTLHGLPFIPTSILASGRRVYFVSDVEGGGPTYRQAVAWIDVPGNPFLTSLDAQAAFIETTESTLMSALVTSDGIDLVYGGAFDPTASLSAPIADSMFVVSAPIASLAADAGIVAASGADLVSYRYASGHHPAFALISGIAANSGTATPEHAVAAYGPVDNQASFASGQDGTVLWESAPLRTTDAGITSDIVSARLAWLAPTGDGGLFDTTVYADLESYPDASAVTVVGPAVWVDANTSVALAATKEDLESTSVQVFDRTTGALVPGKRGLIPAPPGSLGVAASGGFIYVLAEDDATNRTASVYVLAPGCSGAGAEPPSDAGSSPSEGGPIEGDAGSPSDGGGGHGTHPGFVNLGAQQ
jgi:hypothetical protein